MRTIPLKEGLGEVRITAPVPPLGCGFSLRASAAQRLQFSEKLVALAERRLTAESLRLRQEAEEKPLVRKRTKGKGLGRV